MTTTIVAYLNNLLVIVGIGVLFAILPRFSAYRTLFGTAVERSVEESTAAQLSHRKYVRTVSVFTALALTLSGCGVLFVQRWLLPAGIIVVIGGGALGYVIQWRRFRLHGRDSDGYRVGSLRPARPMRSNWIVNGTASLPLLGAALYAALKRGQLPANLPTRWGFDGRVSAWAVNTPFHVVRPAIIGLLSLAFLNIMLWATASFGRIDRNAGDSTLHRTAFIVGAVSWVLSINLALIMVLFVTGHPTIIFLAMSSADLTIAIASFVLFLRMIRRGGHMLDSTTNRDWKVGIFYWNPTDSALLVPKRFGIGYTVNLAHPSGWLVGFGIPLMFATAVIALLRY